ncbi:hypothetical protein SLEP1_g4425 [Rubroshorea leprosula]|uniref:SPX domain-containing protein n=1 Tax=Rubroshorea leprosula TaxID=152421 RepID=A0AAV5HXH7_9ROSI|nr:hypothetical protein SLEP1_g4425 [Rubroshorea leprosula]
MVKFSKQFEGQLVPEWKEAFVDYWQLKKDLKKFHPLNETPAPPKKQHTSLVSTILSLQEKLSSFCQKNTDHGAIHVHRTLASSAGKNDVYETELLEQFSDTNAANEFFQCLDMQLNKVNWFYKTKEKEFLYRAESLKKQMEILIELKTALKQKSSKGVSPQDFNEDASISCTISCGK